jgi:catechol 2,3-dioxygenase-like lactoylglutathione lyase family enzyme
MSVKVYGCNHVAIEVDDIEKAVAFYQDVFNLEKLNRSEGDAFFKLGEHQFLAVFEVDKVQPANARHFGIMVRDELQLEEVREKLTTKYKLKLEPPFRCDFRDPWGNRIQVVDLHDESLIWLLPYRECKKLESDSTSDPNSWMDGWYRESLTAIRRCLKKLDPVRRSRTTMSGRHSHHA